MKLHRGTNRQVTRNFQDDKFPTNWVKFGKKNHLRTHMDSDQF